MVLIFLLLDLVQNVWFDVLRLCKDNPQSQYLVVIVVFSYCFVADFLTYSRQADRVGRLRAKVHTPSPGCRTL